jgi:protein-S-isoprenylcysteine O-methyltransferase Ste14
MWLRHLLAIAVLPFTVTVVVPVWIARRYGATLQPGATMSGILLQSAGAALLATGAALFIASLRRFSNDGDGTLAPWDPPRRLVVRGPYRYVRNPMISGVVLVLFGESMVLLSASHAAWAVLFVTVNLILIPLIEEPRLRHRFGTDYDAYCRNVPRLLPRLRPWQPGPGR